MKKMVLTVILSVIAAFAADAQKSIFTESDMKAFSAVNISDEFVVTLKESEDYVLKTNIDERIDSYVAAYVKDGVLYLDIESANNELKPESDVAYSNYGRIRVSQWHVGETKGANQGEFTKAESLALPVITEMEGIYTLKTDY